MIEFAIAFIILVYCSLVVGSHKEIFDLREHYKEKQKILKSLA